MLALRQAHKRRGPPGARRRDPKPDGSLRLPRCSGGYRSPDFGRVGVWRQWKDQENLGRRSSAGNAAPIAGFPELYAFPRLQSRRPIDRRALHQRSGTRSEQAAPSHCRPASMASDEAAVTGLERRLDATGTGGVEEQSSLHLPSSIPKGVPHTAYDEVIRHGSSGKAGKQWRLSPLLQPAAPSPLSDSSPPWPVPAIARVTLNVSLCRGFRPCSWNLRCTSARGGSTASW